MKPMLKAGAFVDRKRITGQIYAQGKMRSPVWIFVMKEDNGRATARIAVTIERMKQLLRESNMLIEQDVVCTSRADINSVAA